MRISSCFSSLPTTYKCCTCAIRSEVRYFRTSNRIFPGSLVPDRWSWETRTLGTRVCSYSGEAAGCVHACRFWPNHGVEYGWFVLSTVLLLLLLSSSSLSSLSSSSSSLSSVFFHCHYHNHHHHHNPIFTIFIVIVIIIIIVIVIDVIIIIIRNSI